MSIATQAKRLTYLVHRWTGIAGCLLMLLWFVSGIVMLYVGYPKLTPWERLGALPELDPQSCCVAVTKTSAGANVGAAVLTSIAGRPTYVFESDDGRLVSDAQTGTPQAAPVSAEQALRAAQYFASTDATSARSQGSVRPIPANAISPRLAEHSTAIVAEHHGTIHEDRWTHSRGLDSHRPLHKIQVLSPSRSTLYVSSRTGQVVLDAPLTQQRWNYVGAWLHWLYMFRTTSVDPAWSWIVIVLSALGTVSALSGLLIGLWRWRFSGRYKSGSHSPYREPWMKWHHVTGLLFGGIVCTWIFSGLMSMNPVGIFSSTHGPNLKAYEGAPQAPLGPLSEPQAILAALQTSGFFPVELSWKRLGGQGYVVAHDKLANTRVVRMTNGQLEVTRSVSAAEAAFAARRLFPAPISHETITTSHDAYYYQRHPEAMNGALMRSLPALRINFEDAERTRVYINLATGAVATSLSRPERVGRWLFYFLHSWDTPWLLGWSALRDAALIVLSLGAIVLAAAGTVIAWRRLRRRKRAVQAQQAQTQG